MVKDVLIVSIIGGVLCLDRFFIQALISRPIVAAPLTGLIMGDPYTGLISGAFIELFWIDRLPIGVCMIPNDTIAAVLIAACSIESGQILGHLSHGLIACAVLVFTPLALFAQRMELWMIRCNERHAHLVVGKIAKGDIQSISQNHLLATFRAWLIPTCIIMIAFPIGLGLMTWSYVRLAPWATRGLELLYGLIPMIGVAVALNTVHVRGKIPIICGVFLVVSIVLYYVHPA